MLEMYPKGRIFQYPCVIEDSMAPGEVEAHLMFGSRIVYVLAPISKVDREHSTIQVVIIGQSGDTFLVGLPGEVENAGPTIRVSKADFNGGDF